MFVPFTPIGCTSIVCINIVQITKEMINAIPDIRIFIPFVFISFVSFLVVKSQLNTNIKQKEYKVFYRNNHDTFRVIIKGTLENQGVL